MNGIRLTVGAVSVSYTHLDVYKRQEHGGAHVNVSMFIRYRKLSSDMQKTTAIYSDYG